MQLLFQVQMVSYLADDREFDSGSKYMYKKNYHPIFPSTLV